MRRQLTKVSVIALLVIVLLGALVPVVEAAPDTQTWYLTSDGKPGAAPAANDGQTHAKDNLMNKDSRTGTGSFFNLPSDEVAWFYANTGAEFNLSFGENSWTAQVRTEAISGDEIGKHLTVEICKLDNATGNVTVLASHSEELTAAGSKFLWEITCEDNGGSTQDFSTGDWLAIRLSWDYLGDTLNIYYKAEVGSDSYIESPSADPGYPVSELPTIILLSICLFILGGYLWPRRGHRFCRGEA